MQFTRITLRNTRIIQSAIVEPGPGFNYIVGGNGSGKTSLLEGIHTLSTGNSFRTGNPISLIRHHQNVMQSFAEFLYRCDGNPHRIGIERMSDGSTKVKIDHQRTHRLADLTQTIPLLALHPESHWLINGGPSQRRKLIDWGVFHVEPGFISVWRHYKRALEQRNEALKRATDIETIHVWDHSLAELGERLHGYRVRYLSALSPFLSSLLGKAGWGSSVTLSLRRGWSEEVSLENELTRSLKRDRLYRNTGTGPHRAELLIKENGHEIRNMFSRGQQKLLIYLLRIAQANYLQSVRDIRSVFLCDDLPAELDRDKRTWVSEALKEAGYQVFATSIEPFTEEFSALQSRMFHVKHGVVY